MEARQIFDNVYQKLKRGAEVYYDDNEEQVIPEKVIVLEREAESQPMGEAYARSRTVDLKEEIQREAAKYYEKSFPKTLNQEP